MAIAKYLSALEEERKNTLGVMTVRGCFMCRFPAQVLPSPEVPYHFFSLTTVVMSSDGIITRRARRWRRSGRSYWRCRTYKKRWRRHEAPRAALAGTVRPTPVACSPHPLSYALLCCLWTPCVWVQVAAGPVAVRRDGHRARHLPQPPQVSTSHHFTSLHITSRRRRPTDPPVDTLCLSACSFVLP